MAELPDATIELTIVTDPKRTPNFTVWWGDPLVVNCTLPEGMTFEGISEVLCQIKPGGVTAESSEALIWASVVPDQESSEARFSFTADATAQLPITRREGQYWMVVKLVREDSARGSLTFYGGNLTAVRHNFSGQPTAQPIPGSSQFATRNELDGKADLVDGKVPLDQLPSMAGAVESVAGKQGVVTLTKADVGLPLVDNVADADKAISTLTQAALNLKAALASPAFTGVPTAPTASVGTNTLQLATTAFVQAAVAALVNSAPSQLDTIKELATALGNDANFATSITAALATKAQLNGPAFTGAPTAPTPTPGNDSTNRIATTAFVQAVKQSILDGGFTFTSRPSILDFGRITTQEEVAGVAASLVPRALSGPDLPSSGDFFFQQFVRQIPSADMWAIAIPWDIDVYYSGFPAFTRAGWSMQYDGGTAIAPESQLLAALASMNSAAVTWDAERGKFNVAPGDLATYFGSTTSIRWDVELQEEVFINFGVVLRLYAGYVDAFRTDNFTPISDWQSETSYDVGTYVYIGDLQGAYEIYRCEIYTATDPRAETGEWSIATQARASVGTMDPPYSAVSREQIPASTTLHVWSGVEWKQLQTVS